MPKDREGIVKTAFLGPMASCHPDVSSGCLSAEYFWQLADCVKTAGGGVISLPLLTNLVLWYRTFHPSIMGIDRHIAAATMATK